jgi:hypothetical protein
MRIAEYAAITVAIRDSRLSIIPGLERAGHAPLQREQEWRAFAR